MFNICYMCICYNMFYIRVVTLYRGRQRYLFSGTRMSSLRFMTCSDSDGRLWPHCARSAGHGFADEAGQVQVRGKMVRGAERTKNMEMTDGGRMRRETLYLSLGPRTAAERKRKREKSY